MARYIFVDYENVGALGLMGIESLQPDDKLTVVATGSSSNRINVDMLKRLAKAIDMNLVINHVERHDAADFRIIAEIGICMRYIRKTKDEIHILTEDRGFDAAIEGFKAAGYYIRRNTSIAKVCNSQINNKKCLQYVMSKVYGYKLCITQFINAQENEVVPTNQKATIRYAYIIYRASKDMCEFEQNLEAVEFNGFVINSLVYIFDELTKEGIL